MNVTVTTAPAPPPPPEDIVTITLTRSEAERLRGLLCEHEWTYDPATPESDGLFHVLGQAGVTRVRRVKHPTGAFYKVMG